ncbi:MULTISPECIES: hypothetical protein [unclassified Mycolicibacterium]|uniref:channel accessory protein ArfC, sunset domain variant n=1 Tax=unclassified Mycolicibacterium TaxID=2636767 RepID=UPI0012DDF792|nr:MULTISPECIES: hypothetical protein [unclassified Mycolicibacterium]MUL85869.1 hypothetical protein [Mycolicibacterium sp. CBMA 329]MUL90239.1 hypothetical protein [Mycolicibacterium sp. CBMA 331]MUM01008.1 hypothetical protein [Mycolicibacterium sp. CBMA 334]MUM29858.1 hypothetical protein [Mycolicibacterium sp. CBMA 295]MUM39754.1 hypothetical protein [Mycolicibacterium sp. CBMA 247]
MTMSGVNWWLMALAFVLGLVLTLALTLRRVKREVPVYGALGRRPESGAASGAATGGGAAGAATAVADDATTKLPRVGAVDEPTTKLPKVTDAGTAAAAAAGAAGAAKFASGGGTDAAAGDDVKVVEEAPYGAGSLRVSGAGTPTGYLIKGNEDSMLYHSPESPSYSMTIAEIWFADVESAEKAGFNRWDSGKSQRGRK